MIKLNKDRKMCPDRQCSAYEGHHPRCKLASDEYKARQLEHYYEAWLEQEIKHRRRS